MGMSNCERCWEDDCVCGYKYKKISPETKTSMILGLTKYMSDAERVSIIEAIQKQEKAYSSLDITKEDINKNS